MAIDLAVRRLGYLMETITWSLSGAKARTKAVQSGSGLLVR